MAEVPSELMDSNNLEDEFKYPVNNTYVIQSSAGAESIEVPDKPSIYTSHCNFLSSLCSILIDHFSPEPIKLLIKRVENEEEVCTTNYDTPIDTVREKSKRIRNPWLVIYSFTFCLVY